MSGKQFRQLLSVIGFLAIVGCERSTSTPRPTTPVVTTPVVTDNNTRYLLALGDSYTIGTGVAITETFSYQLAQRWRDQGMTVAVPMILARNGYTTQQLIDAWTQTVFRPPYDAVTVLIGVNNQYQGRDTQEYRIQLQWILQRAIEQSGNRPERVVVMSIPDYSVTPFVSLSDKPRVAQEINRWNALKRTVAAERGLRFLDITTYSRTAASDRSLLAFDSLHFSAKAYAVWADSLNRILLPIVKPR